MKIAINGYGRIGRCILRALFNNRAKYHDIELVAINSLGNDLNIHAHLTQYDSIHGKFAANLTVAGNELCIDDRRIKFLAIADPKQLPWHDLKVDVVLECSGAFTSKAKAVAHIHAGAQKVLLSAPATNNDVDATIVYGVNQHKLSSEMQIVSNASCTTNCLAPIAHVLNQGIGIDYGLMTTIHSYTNDQVLTDNYHDNIYRARAASLSMIPTKTGAAQAVGLVLPELNGKLDGLAIRVPTANVSLVDLVFTALRSTTVSEVNQLISDAAANATFKDVLAYNDAPLVSTDFNHSSYSSIFDATQTKVIGNLVKVFSWYDNEWGFANRMLDVSRVLGALCA